MVFEGARNCEIERLYSLGVSYAALARQFGLSRSRVTHIVWSVRRMRHKVQARLDAPLRHVT